MHYMSRSVYEDHVLTLMDSFTRTATVNEDVSAVVVNEKLFNEWNGDKQRKPSCDDFLEAQKDKHARKPICFAGAHTREAMDRLATKYPGSKRWRTFKFKAFVCAGTPHDIRMIRILGNSNNTKNKNFLAQSFVQVIEGMHHQGLDVLQNECDGNAKGPAMLQFKEDVANSLDLPPNSVGQYWQIAKQQDEVWDAFHKLFHGEYTPKQPSVRGKSKKKQTEAKAPEIRSCHPFVFMMPMSNSFILHHLESVLNGDETIQQMQINVKHMRARIRLQDEITDYISNNFGIPELSDQEVTDYISGRWPECDELMNMDYHRCACEYEGLDDHVDTWILNVSQMPLKRAIDRTCFDQVGEKVKKAKRQKVQTISIFFLLFVHTFFCNL